METPAGPCTAQTTNNQELTATTNVQPVAHRSTPNAASESITNSSDDSPSSITSLEKRELEEASHMLSWTAKILQFKPVHRMASNIVPKSLNARGHKPRQPRVWRTSWLRLAPLSGIVAMLLAIASLIASLGILAGSDHEATANWSVPPSTYLAIFTATANLSVRYAAIQGVVITWWYRASRGSTLAKLHWNWREGTTLRGALTAGRHMGLLGVACIMSTLVVVDGPLLQRASTVVQTPIVDSPATLEISIAPEIPTDYSGAWQMNNIVGGADSHFNLTIPTNYGIHTNALFAYPDQTLIGIHGVTNAWYAESPLAGVIRGCPGSCRFKLHAPSLFPTCTTRTVPMNPYIEWDTDKFWISEQAPPLTSDAFMVNTNLLHVGGYEVINLITGRSRDAPNCTGTFEYEVCTLESGIGEYDVEVVNNEIQMDKLGTPTMVALANNTEVNYALSAKQGLHPSTLRGISYLIWNRYNCIISYIPTGKGGIEAYFECPQPWSAFVRPETVADRCPSYFDQKDMVINSMNKVAVYIGAWAAAHYSNHLPHQHYRMDPGVSLNTTVTGQHTGLHNVYHTDYWFFAGAAIVVVVCIAFIAPTYYGWWKLGRPVSLSPLETAKAFDAPLLADHNSNSSGRDLAKAVDDSPVQYGVVHIGDTGQDRKLAFANAAVVTPPESGSRFGP